MRKKKIFDSDSVINEKTNLDEFVPPYPGWNYVRLLEHPEDTLGYGDTGKWLVFVPAEKFLEAFRKISKLAKEFKLTQCFKASGESGNQNSHVFCIYCGNYKDIPFVRKVAETLLKEGILDEYGYQYRDGTKSLFFKTDETTHYKSDAIGESLTLFKFTDKGELYIKEFIDKKPNWKLATRENQDNLIDNFEDYLMMLQFGDEGMDD